MKTSDYGDIRWLSLHIISFFYQVGKLSTGDSLDMSAQDEASIVANDATVKDMEVEVEVLMNLL